MHDVARLVRPTLCKGQAPSWLISPCHEAHRRYRIAVQAHAVPGACLTRPALTAGPAVDPMPPASPFEGCGADAQVVCGLSQADPKL